MVPRSIPIAFRDDIVEKFLWVDQGLEESYRHGPGICSFGSPASLSLEDPDLDLD